MADYQRMYAMLCSAVAAVIPALEEIPAANPSMRILQQALLNAEELYIQTTPYGTRGQEVRHLPDDSSDLIHDCFCPLGRMWEHIILF